jgi:hypothetical protein
MTLKIIASAALLLSAFGACYASTAPSPTSPGGKLARPPLETHQGRYFRWASPKEWKQSESTNGISLTSPDGKQMASSVMLLRSTGRITPIDFLTMMLGKMPGYSAIRVINVKNLPGHPSGYPGLSWKLIEAELQYNAAGTIVSGLWTCGIVENYGYYDAILSGFQASQTEWPKARLYLPEVLRSVRVTNPSQVAMNDQVLRPRNNPLDNSALIESWRQKGLSQDRISQGTREGIMGYEKMKDPKTGQIINMPLESYDGTVGGYRNPYRPTEILQKAQPSD